MKIQHVPLQHAAQTWPLVESYMAESQAQSKEDYTLDQIKMYVLTGGWLLLVATDEENKIHGAMTVEFFNRPNHRVAFITGTGGKSILGNHFLCSAMIGDNAGSATRFFHSLGSETIS